MNKSSDELLIYRLKENDQKALEMLYERYFHSLCDFAFAIVKSIELAEEAVSDVFFNIWSKRDSLDINFSLKSYLYLAVKNQSINYLKKKNLNHEDIDIIKIVLDIQDNKTAETNIELKELEIEIQNILNELPAQRRLIFKLNRIDGLKYKEISETLSISVNTVQKQMTEAIKHVEKYKHHLRATLHVSTILFTFWHS